MLPIELLLNVEIIFAILVDMVEPTGGNVNDVAFIHGVSLRFEWVDDGP